MNKGYRFLQILLKPFYKIFYRMRVTGLENELPDGPCIICANHISMHDIFLIAVNLKRQIFFFAKKELFKNPLLARFLRSFGTISVNRGTVDLHSITATIEVLRAGANSAAPIQSPEQARNALRAVTKDEVRDILRRLTLSVSYLLTKEDAAHAAE